MKKSKKLLSLFLAALMLISCFGAISASAMTMDAAEAAAAEFNATIPDHSAVYANKSAKQWRSTKDALNKTLAAILAQQDLKKTIYSDATVNTLLVTIGDLVYNALKNAGGVASILAKQYSVSQVGKKMSDAGVYPEIAAYLQTLEAYSDIDAERVVWGITPGNRDQFINAIGWALSANLGGIIALLVGPLGLAAYNTALVPLLEALHVGKFPDAQTFQANANINGTFQNNLYVEQLADYLCDVIDAFIANPIDYLCEVLPDLVYVYPTLPQGLSKIPYVGKMVAELLPDTIGGLLAMLTDALGMKLTLPSINEQYVYTMGKAVVIESGRAETDKAKIGSYALQVKGDSTMVFAAVAQYVGEVLQNADNQVEIGRFVVSKIGPEYEDNYLEIVEAAKNGTALDVADSCLSLVEEFATNIGAQEDVNPVVAFFAKIAAFFSNLAKKIIALFK